MIHFIINPGSQSGHGMQQWLELKTKLDNLKLTYDTYFTHSYKETISYVSSITAPDNNGQLHQLAVLGGDGTVNEVINGVADRLHTCITYFPTGSGNDLARSLGLDKTAGTDVTRLLSMKNAIRADLGWVTCMAQNGTEITRAFTISCGIGFDAASCARANNSCMKHYLNRFGLGKLSYLLNAIVCLFQIPRSSIRLTLDNQTSVSRDNNLFCVSCVQKYEGGGFAFCPNTNSQDGKYDICLIHNVRPIHALYLIPMVKLGLHVCSHRVNRYRAKELAIQTSSPLYVHTDGEILGQFQQLRLHCPPDSSILFR